MPKDAFFSSASNNKNEISPFIKELIIPFLRMGLSQRTFLEEVMF